MCGYICKMYWPHRTYIPYKYILIFQPHQISYNMRSLLCGLEINQNRSLKATTKKPRTPRTRISPYIRPSIFPKVCQNWKFPSNLNNFPIPIYLDQDTSPCACTGIVTAKLRQTLRANSSQIRSSCGSQPSSGCGKRRAFAPRVYR